jgi:hypothetical protein
VIVSLGQYYEENMSRVSDWSASYRINVSTGTVAGFTASVAQTAAYDYYVGHLAGSIDQRLGVSQYVVQGFSPLSLDVSYLQDRGVWQDVTEYKYILRNTDKPVYLTIKTYVNGSTGVAEGVDVSAPYYSTVATTIH